MPYQTFQLTDSSLAVGLLGVAEFAPILALALVGGALADAFDRGGSSSRLWWPARWTR